MATPTLKMHFILDINYQKKKFKNNKYLPMLIIKNYDNFFITS